jgi:hypothetical protein
VALYSKDKRFSIGWVLGGTVIMLITNLLAGLLAGMVGVRSLAVLTGIAVGCFAFGGFVIGWKSEGQTILESGVAAILACVVGLAIRMVMMHQSLAGMMNPIALAIGFGIPFAAGLFGGWIGEKVQGETVGSDG